MFKNKKKLYKNFKTDILKDLKSEDEYSKNVLTEEMLCMADEGESMKMRRENNQVFSGKWRTTA